MPLSAQQDISIVSFDAVRTIGVPYVAGNGKADFPGVWQNQLMPRADQIDKPQSPRCFGIGRCIPGVKDGTWQYIAAVEATPASPVPAGMIEVLLPAGDYATRLVPSLKVIAEAWTAFPPAVHAMTGYDTFCNARRCDCATRPSFELYPADFAQTGRLYLYMPVRRT